MLNNQGAFSVLNERRICRVCSVILIIYAHPYPEKSRVNKLMLRVAANNPEVVIRAVHGAYLANQSSLIKQIRHYGERLACWREV
ncbi:Glutathione-regulated potassium-efflux system ancillary protein KefF [Pseudomonas sp. R1-43-08]|uniref:hypothetical protein n=1 Tax=Pseudomonas sp. R1-43-08 TaxID=1173270 RepID=UPI000F6D2188|nr:hypothetical protein [Pseudomonas sp. R1-43-08]AZF43404.1 Glutathione-regulated potassium-efflux system ancillary protein KefF [Pseudomonas sp. R1-43-08]